MSSDQNSQNADPSPTQVGPLGTSLLGIYLLLLALLLSYLVYGLWPSEKHEIKATETPAKEGGKDAKTKVIVESNKRHDPFSLHLNLYSLYLLQYCLMRC